MTTELKTLLISLVYFSGFYWLVAQMTIGYGHHSIGGWHLGIMGMALIVLYNKEPK